MSRIFLFILCDHVSDEFRLTDRFCIESAFKKFEPKKMSNYKMSPQISFVKYFHQNLGSM